MVRNGFRSMLYPMLLWLPLTFALWFYCGALLSILVACVLDVLLPPLTGGHIARVESAGQAIHAVVLLGSGTYPGLEVPEGQTAELMLQSRPMVFAYGMPVFMALAFAADSRCGVSRLGLGLCLLALLAVATFGAGMDLVKSVFFNLPPELAEAVRPRGLQAELIALGYQFGALILPLVVPLLLGCWLCASWFRQMLLVSSATNDEPSALP